MAKKRNPYALSILILIMVIVAGLVFWDLGQIRQKEGEAERGRASSSSRLALLGEAPDWSRLDPYQKSIKRNEFIKLLKEVYLWRYTEGWEQFFIIKEDEVWIKKSQAADSEKESSYYKLAFQGESAQNRSSEGLSKRPSKRPIKRYWRTVEELPSLNQTQLEQRPLEGIRIAIDPGHIGGAFAQIEERYFTVGEGSPVMEGEMTLEVAYLLKPLLEKLGAEVLLVREQTRPVTDKRSSDFMSLAEREDQSHVLSEKRVKLLADKYFYRVSEIRERGHKVNQVLRPDLVLCLHFNAEAWGDPAQPSFTEKNHLHLILHGSYMEGEIAHDDERFQLVFKLLQRIHGEEKALSRAVAHSFADRSGLPPYLYSDSKPAMNIDQNPYLWARNLLANRLYECPVIYLEPYVMNNQDVYDRIQLGDYDGKKMVKGVLRESIYREYANAVVEGLKRYYLEQRAQK